MRNKRILVLTSSFPRSKHDWWAQFIASLYTHMSSAYDITILGPDAPNALKKEKMGQLSIHRFSYFFPRNLQILTTGAGILHSSKTNLLARFQIPFFIISAACNSFVYTVRYKPDIFHAHWLIPQGLIGVVIKKLFNIPLIVTVHGSDVFGLKRFTVLKKFVLRNADICTVNSTYTQKAVRKLDSSVPIQVIPMGVDVSVFSPKKKSRQVKNKLNSTGPILLCVGRLIGVKGFSYAINAMPAICKRFPRAKLVIVGNGPLKDDLIALTKQLSVQQNCIFISSIPHKTLSEYYATSDVCLVPSITDPVTGETESQGVVALEAMSSGIPVVASKSGGIPDAFVQGENGILVSPANPSEIADAVISLLLDSVYAKKMGKQARKTISKQYDWHTIGRLFDQVYSQLLQDHS